jgi:hypothetical protein
MHARRRLPYVFICRCPESRPGRHLAIALCPTHPYFILVHRAELTDLGRARSLLALVGWLSLVLQVGVDRPAGQAE